MSIELSVIAPCFNEVDNVDSLVARLEAVLSDLPDHEIILVDDGSADGTGEAIDRLAGTHGSVVAVHHPKNAGITEAWATGLAHARGRYLVTIDADMQYRPEDIPRLYAAIEASGDDLVMGWRDDYNEASFLRRVLSRGLSGMLNLAFLRNVRDIKSGFVIYRREVYARIMADRHLFDTYQHFMILCALAAGFRLSQIPVAFDPRVAGESFIQQPLQFSSRVLRDMPVALRHYGPQVSVRQALEPLLGGSGRSGS